MPATLRFPEHFFWGTSTAAAQVETATDHNWRGITSRDGYRFERTTDHELRRLEDAEYIARLGSVYRCGVDWARLQPHPKAPFVPAAVAEYTELFELLRSKGVRIMFVLHHFTQPRWFDEAGGWTAARTLPLFMDYVQQCVQHFGPMVHYWNTFNEPNVFVSNGYLLGNFPPFGKGRLMAALRAVHHMARAHRACYDLLRRECPQAPVGISANTALFRGDHWLGRLPAAVADYWFNRYIPDLFMPHCDFCGLSYYTLMPFVPQPLTEMDNPGELARRGYAHDRMWAYYPEGLGIIVRRFWRRYHLPVVITENGICTDDPQRRIQAIQDYLKVLHACLADGVDLRGYIHWSTWDNFEWSLGPTYRFGLVQVDFDTMQRTVTPAAEFYSRVAATGTCPLA